MTDITEADHDAVDWLYEMGVIAPHHLRLANEAFARHREQTERQSADLIETQAREIERLREALREVLDHARHADSCAVYHPTRKPCSCGFETDDEAARAALAGDSHDQ